jgi:hypothetical protein
MQAAPGSATRQASETSALTRLAQTPFHPFLAVGFVAARRLPLLAAVGDAGALTWWLLGGAAVTLGATLLLGTLVGVRRAALAVTLLATALLNDWARYTSRAVLIAVVAAALVQLLRPSLVDALTVLVNLFLLFLYVPILFAVGRITWASRPPEVRAGRLDELPAVHPAAGRLPDVWWIVLDAHGRADVLCRKGYPLQNDLGGSLARLGFVVVPNARSNYAFTELSLASMLNFELLQDLLVSERPAGASRTPVSTLLSRNRLTRVLQRLGYRFVHHPSGYSLVDRPLAEVSEAEIHGPRVRFSDVGGSLLNATIAPSLTQFLVGRDERGALLAALHRRRLRSAIEWMKKGDGESPRNGPVFRLVHVMAPHPPFVMRRDGSDAPYLRQNFVFWDNGTGTVRMTREEYVERYSEQVDWLAHDLPRAIESILERSATPPVIVVHGDHGPRTDASLGTFDGNDVEDRFGVFLAVRAPGVEPGSVPDDLSLVNVPRVILNRVFGADLPLVGDRSYLNIDTEPFRFLDVTETAAHAP